MQAESWRRPDVLAAALLAAVGFAVVAFVRAGRPVEPVPVVEPERPQISVHVAGEVVWPDLYVLRAGARVQDAVMAAHGPTSIADLRQVNLAAVLRDGDRVVIPRIVQPPYPFHLAPMSRPPGAGAGTAAGGPQPVTGASNRSRSDVDGAAAAVGPPGGDPGAAVNLNTATEAELERLPGVGPVLAHRIVAFREAKGLFRRLEDLQEVEGIGPRLYRRLAPHLRLD